LEKEAAHGTLDMQAGTFHPTRIRDERKVP